MNRTCAESRAGRLPPADALTGNADLSATAGQTNLCGMFGLNADPVTDNNYTSLDFAWYLAGSTLNIYENGGQIGSYGGYSTTDEFAISYDSSNVRYLVNGEVKRTVAITANRTLYFDSSFYDTNFRLDNIRFEPNSAQGTVLAYDAAGNRRQATRYESGVAVAEAYTYDINNRLVSTNKSGNLTSSRAYDGAGRVTEQVTYGSPGVVSERRANTYNANQLKVPGSD